LNLSGEQARYAEDMSNTLGNKDQDSNVVATFRRMSAAPGAGKTTTIIASLEYMEENNKTEIDEMLKNGEKILIIVFNSKNKKEIESKIKAKGLYTELYEVSTVNSLFFRNLGPSISTKATDEEKAEQKLEQNKKKQDLLKKLGGFELDYKKGFFSKQMITELMRSMTKGEKFESEIAEKELGKKRLFSGEILSANNIEVLWSLINGYFASPYAMGDISNIETTGEFFGKKPVSIQDITLPDKDKDLLSNLIRKKKITNTTTERMFFRAMLARTVELASFKEITRTTVTSDIDVSIPVIIERPMADGYGDMEITDEYMITSRSATVKTETKNIFKVPHSYYVKNFFKLIMKDKEMMESVFGKFKKIINDETQDSSLIDYLIIEAVAAGGIVNDVTFVGDSNQGIYAFKSPDHFDTLKHVEGRRELLMKKGIEIKNYDLSQTYRFGMEQARFVNNLFGTDIKGNPEKEDFVHPSTIDTGELVSILQRTHKRKSTAIVCRGNKEALRLFVDLKANGYGEVKLESSIKKEVGDFVKKGIMSLDDEHARMKVYKALSRQYGKRKMVDYSYEDIMSCYGAKQAMIDSGFSKLVQFTPDEVENYIVGKDSRSTNITWIGTAHVFKGGEYDLMFLAGDFLRRELGGEEPEVVVDLDEDDFLLAMGGSTGKEEKKDKKDKKEIKTTSRLKDILASPVSLEEANILYVALTRGKEGLYMLESPVGEHLVSNYDLDVELNRKRSDSCINEDEVAIKKAEAEADIPNIFTIDTKNT